MDWTNFRNIVNENLPEIMRWIVTLVISTIALVVAIVRTRTSAIIKKSHDVDPTKNLDLQEYEVVIGDETYNLENLKIKKRRKIDERKKNEEKQR